MRRNYSRIGNPETRGLLESLRKDEIPNAQVLRIEDDGDLDISPIAITTEFLAVTQAASM